VQSLLGSGHLRRALLVAEALAARGAAVTLVNGGLPGPWAAASGIEVAQLPPVIAKGTDFATLVEPDGTPVTSVLRAERGRRLLELLAQERPDVLITEMFPFGRRGFKGELVPLLDAAVASSSPPVIAASVRDVLVSKPDPARYAWMAGLCQRYYDRVLVHGDARLLPFAASFPLAETLGQRLAHTGYVRPSAPTPTAGLGSTPAVLVSAGGGAVGDRLLGSALAARALSAWREAAWLLVGGHNLPQAAFASLEAQMPAGCSLVRHRADLPVLMGRCQVSVSQAGYNTVVEGLIARARMVLVPFAAAGEDEQARRATRLHDLGLAAMIAESALTPMALADAIDRRAAAPRPVVGAWSFDGAERSAEILAALVAERRRVA
jgi:predicted glycosyltransferase